MDNWIDGFGGYFDPYLVKTQLEIALKIVENRAEDKLKAFDFTQYKQIFKSGWFWKTVTEVSMFTERMPATVEQAVRVKSDISKVIYKASTKNWPDYVYYWEWDAVKDFQTIVYDFAHVRKLKGVLNGIDISIDCGMKTIVFTDEAFSYYTSALNLIEQENKK